MCHFHRYNYCDVTYQRILTLRVSITVRLFSSLTVFYPRRKYVVFVRSKVLLIKLQTSPYGECSMDVVPNKCLRLTLSHCLSLKLIFHNFNSRWSWPPFPPEPCATGKPILWPRSGWWWGAAWSLQTLAFSHPCGPYFQSEQSKIFRWKVI